MKGKIYKLVDVGYNKCYIGSTIENLSNRIAKHRYSYKMWCSGKRTIKMTVFDMFDEFGVDNIKIEEIEKYPCKDKAELEAREGYYIQRNECVNRCVAGRSKSQWNEENKERQSQNKHQYYQNNKEKWLQSSERRKEQTTCECGCLIKKNSMPGHLKTPKHQNYLNQMKQQEPINNS